MKQDSLKTFVALRDALNSERNSIQNRLTEINRALGVGGVSASTPAAVEGTLRGRRPGRKRGFSAETRAKLAEAQQRRRARERGETLPVTSTLEKKTAPAKDRERTMSLEAKAKIAAAKKKWWAARKKAGK